MTDFKPKIISELDVLRRVSTTEPAGTFKARAYAAAIKTLSELPHIRSAEDVPAPKKGDGLGKEIRIKIAKILETGSLDIDPTVRAKADTLEIFQGIYGVGPKKAEELIAAGYTTLAAVRAAVDAGTLKFTKNQVIGLKHYEDLQLRIPRAEMEDHAALLMKHKPAALEGVIVGSYRRGRPDSGDIDMLIRTADASVDAPAALRQFITALTEIGYVREILAVGPHKCLAIAGLPSHSAPAIPVRRLDLLVTPPAEFPFAVLYFTGSDGFNVAMRARALERGYTLNEHALTATATGKAVQGIKSERDIFAALRMAWKEPTERTGPEAVVPL